MINSECSIRAFPIVCSPSLAHHNVVILKKIAVRETAAGQPDKVSARLLFGATIIIHHLVNQLYS